MNNLENDNQKENIVDDTIKELCHLIMQSRDEKFLYDFFTCLFTKPELKDIANRWLLVKEITRVTKELRKPESPFRKMLDINKQ